MTIGSAYLRNLAAHKTAQLSVWLGRAQCTQWPVCVCVCVQYGNHKHLHDVRVVVVVVVVSASPRRSCKTDCSSSARCQRALITAIPARSPASHLAGTRASTLESRHFGGPFARLRVSASHWRAKWAAEMSPPPSAIPVGHIPGRSGRRLAKRRRFGSARLGANPQRALTERRHSHALARSPALMSWPEPKLERAAD